MKILNFLMFLEDNLYVFESSLNQGRCCDLSWRSEFCDENRQQEGDEEETISITDGFKQEEEVEEEGIDVSKTIIRNA